MADKRITDLDPAAATGSNIRNYEIEVDEDSNIESESLVLGNLLRTDNLKGQGISAIDYEAVTPKSMLATTSEEGILGLIRIATNALAVAATNGLNALVPSNLDAIFNARLAKTKSYVVGDFDEVASNYTDLTITAFDEMVVGNYTTMQGYISVTVPAVNNIEIFLNATKTPLSFGSLSCTRFSTPFYIAQSGAILTSSGKLKIIIGNLSSAYAAGTYEFAFTLTYFSA